ncbi:MAG: putative ATP-dependent endonuclease of OLD family [Oleiphilaceae bacterium]
MGKIIDLSIQNFRGINTFSQRFNSDFICLIGRGDSGKTTILEAISAVLSPSWNRTFYDTDFHQCDIDKPIEIIASMINFPSELLKDHKYGLHIRYLNPKNGDVEDALTDGYQSVLTLKLIVDKSLEPKWIVINNREQEDKPISASDRAKLNCFIVSDYIDRHFSWNKGSPLYSLLKANETSLEDENKNLIIDALREAKGKIDEGSFNNLSDVVDNITKNAAAFGLDISKTNTTIDFKDLTIKDGRVCLHDENIPFRLKGKGSKRLASIAIQSALLQEGGIMLVDEIEQGLEPDRIRLLARTLKEGNNGQIFITTHSRDVVTELSSEDLMVIHKDKETFEMKVSPLNYDREKLQSVVRACPEAFFANKVIVCEGATEVGICRALDRYRKRQDKSLMSFEDCAYIDGTGSEFVNRTIQIAKTGINVTALCDSDDTGINGKKNEMLKAEVVIVDCEEGHSIEDQLFLDLPWNQVLELVDYAAKSHSKTCAVIENEIVKNYFEVNLPDSWRDNETPRLRQAIAAASQQKHKEKKEKRKSWFKRIDHGEFLGEVIFKCFDTMDDAKHLKLMLTNLSSWIDE